VAVASALGFLANMGAFFTAAFSFNTNVLRCSAVAETFSFSGFTAFTVCFAASFNTSVVSLLTGTAFNVLAASFNAGVS